MEDEPEQPEQLNEATRDRQAFTEELRALLPSNPEDLDPKVSELSIEAIGDIESKFADYTEVDQDGLTRQIYRLEDKSFSFAGREETPIYPTLEQSYPTRLGHEPWRRDSVNNREEYSEEINRQTNYDPALAHLREKNPGKPEHYIVETSPYGIYLLLAKLQPDNATWQARADEIAQGHYDEETLKTIDKVTAVNAFCLSNDPSAAQRPLPGELVAVAALLGDAEAARVIDQALQLQQQREQAVADRAQAAVAERKMLADSTEGSGAEAFKRSDLVVVHATSYEPKETDDGYEVVTTHDATGFPRATIHTSLNHKVENAGMNGEWDNSDYVLITGLDKMLDVNGLPRSLNGADTWWARDPGESLSFPGATLIMPGGEQLSLATEAEHGRIKYKSQGFTEDDVVAAEGIYEGTSTKIREALHDSTGAPISIDSAQGQRIIANSLRDAVVAREIAVTRGKQLERQYDDKHMTQAFTERMNKMVIAEGMPISSSALHTDSDEAEVERLVGRGLYNFNADDPKVRRVAYASGFTHGGGTARQESIKRRTARKIPGA